LLNLLYGSHIGSHLVHHFVAVGTRALVTPLSALRRIRNRQSYLSILENWKHLSVCAFNPLPSDRLRCCDRYIRCQQSLAVKPLQCAYIEQVGLSVYPSPTALHTPPDGRLFTLAWLTKRTGRRHVNAVHRTQSNRTRRSAARLAIAAEFSVAADAASQSRSPLPPSKVPLPTGIWTSI